jgi:para-nitrobenzyl esterase
MAIVLARHAAFVLPPPQSPWAEAMAREVELIEIDSEALVWALGSVFASYSIRAKSIGSYLLRSRRLRTSALVLGVLAALFFLRLPIASAILLRPQSSGELADPIRVEGGLLQGTREKGLTVYRGIPYAAPPVGEFRWKPPQPAEPWPGTLRADAFKPACMQKGPTLPGMEFERYGEDCLYLNVWTPAKSAAEKLAVMVYLHGGGGSSGSGSARLYRGDQLAGKGVVVVTLNYRLGAFGLLAHPELSKESGHAASGDYALMDDIAALRWVRRNITAFGGDADNVTIFSHSAGAYHASQLMVSPIARGLFRRVIAQSGGDFGWTGTSVGFPTLAQAERIGITFGEALHTHSIAELRRVPAETILAKDNEKTTPGGVGGTNRLTVDGYVLPQEVYQSFAEGKEAPVDLLVGYNAGEGDTQLGPPLKASAYVAKVREEYGALADRILTEYPAGSDEEAARSQKRLFTEASFGWHAWSWAELHAKAGFNHVFFYHFARVPPLAPYHRINAAGHGAELPYLFGYPPRIGFYLLEAPWDAYRDVRLEDAIQTYWTNFAKTGDPNGPGLTDWPAYRPGQERVLELDKTITARDLPNRSEHMLMSEYRARLRGL